MYDICDDQLFKEHPLFSTDKHALQLIIYYNDVEVSNPLGSYRGIHKLGLLVSLLHIHNYNYTDLNNIIVFSKYVLLCTW